MIFVFLLLLAFLSGYSQFSLQLRSEGKTLLFHYMRFFKKAATDRTQKYDRVLFLDEERRPIADWSQLWLELEILDEAEGMFTMIKCRSREQKEVEVLKASCYRLVQTPECEYELYRVVSSRSCNGTSELRFDSLSQKRAVLVVERCPHALSNSVDIWIVVPQEAAFYQPVCPLLEGAGFITHFLFLEESGEIFDRWPNESTRAGEEFITIEPEEPPAAVPEPPTFLLVLAAAVLFICSVYSNRPISPEKRKVKVNSAFRKFSKKPDQSREDEKFRNFF